MVRGQHLASRNCNHHACRYVSTILIIETSKLIVIAYHFQLRMNGEGTRPFALRPLHFTQALSLALSSGELHVTSGGKFSWLYEMYGVDFHYFSLPATSFASPHCFICYVESLPLCRRSLALPLFPNLPNRPALLQRKILLNPVAGLHGTPLLSLEAYLVSQPPQLLILWSSAR